MKLFNDYTELDLFEDIDVIKKKDVTLYLEDPNRFDEILEYYSSIKKKKPDVLYHYLMAKGQHIMSDFDAINKVRNSIERKNESNFDLPMFSITTGIKIIGYGDNSFNEDILRSNIITLLNEDKNNKICIIAPYYLYSDISNIPSIFKGINIIESNFG